MKIVKRSGSVYEIPDSNLKAVEINNSIEFDFVGIIIAVLLGIIAWELWNKHVYIPGSVWSVVMVLIIFGVILLFLYVILMIIGVAAVLSFMWRD